MVSFHWFLTKQTVDRRATWLHKRTLTLAVIGGAILFDRASGRTVVYGGVPEWLKGTGCKPVGYAYVGSNPTSSTNSDGFRVVSDVRNRPRCGLIVLVNAGVAQW